MSNQMEFSRSVIEKIGYYVYLLKNPDDGAVFYVGKGRGNRVFAHVNGALAVSTASDKLDLIRSILHQGAEVEHLILRHGLTEKEAFEVEAAVIDLLGLEGLTNLVSGYDSTERGLMRAVDIIAQYDSAPVVIDEAAILVIINRRYYYGISPDEIYEYTRGNWVIGERRNAARYAFAVYKGIIREVYRIHGWIRTQARSKESAIQDRWRFDGEVALELQHYVGGSVEAYLSPGAQNPIRYVNC